MVTRTENHSVCSTPGCTNRASFRTRSRPAWCDDCITEILRKGGLEPVEPFPGKPSDYRLCRCVDCGIEAHYRLEYTVGKNEVGENSCRACYWRHWAQDGRAATHRGFERKMLELLRVLTPDQISAELPLPQVYEFLESGWWPEEKIVARLDSLGFDLVSTVLDVTGRDDPVVTRCRRCGKVSAERMSDVTFGCTCSRNTKASNTRRPGKTMFADSEAPALQWWDHDRNDETLLHTASVRATRTAHWVCPECGLGFEEQVYLMASHPSCPECSTRRQADRHARLERWRTTPVSAVPELVAVWDDDADPSQAMVHATYPLRRLRCPNGHHPRLTPLRYLESGCPSCRANITRSAIDRPTLAKARPEIAAQWHPTRNGNLDPGMIGPDSTRVVWWRSDCCGHEWREQVRDRDKYRRLRCPHCESILDSLAWQDPGLAAEWSPNNPLSPWHVRPHATTRFLPEWVCSVNPEHVWRSPLASRSAGSGCPECREAGKSRVELDHFAAAERAFGAARSGVVLQHQNFHTRTAWIVDMTAQVDDTTVVIEYDGAYWHRPEAKIMVDQRKTADLLRAGYTVVRLREDDLPSLEIDNPAYIEMRVYSTNPQPKRTMARIRHDVTIASRGESVDDSRWC